MVRFPGLPLVAPPAEFPDWAQRAVNLANPRLGAVALAASDEFFAPAARMLSPDPAVFIPGQYDDHGKWMDGWESRRKRGPGQDWALVKLGVAGAIRGFDVDTSHFVGNYPPAVSIEAACAATDDAEALEAAAWTEVLPPTALGPNRHHLLPCANRETWTHLRVNIYPDGGIARLRVYGEVRGALAGAGDALVDLAALAHGGRPIAWNDASFGSEVANLLLPGRGLDMGDGWETRRRLLDARKARGGLAHSVRSRLVTASARMPTMHNVANDLCMTSRTLRRRLVDEGTSFAELRDEVRQTLADELLNGQRLSVAQVAERLGYAEPASFVNAFKRWHGTTPHASRLALRQQV